MKLFEGNILKICARYERLENMKWLFKINNKIMMNGHLHKQLEMGIKKI